ncbi:unnamed protein product [Penicillium salamii]|uniref:Uncharacterized protein n=1 Tax=Penicillium salamii TaxID=1612424 RepID=A0A9W4NIZ9_9EURO|nr:unnamed protein product [Penicillium salamii]CAG8228055.1 unnamed protein product [Penicillium salamii]CAG8314548.1 unnamed protein product [Penicillium salamii]CAG8361296.1 unnamed protein product [Penicillium salamii]CAG8376047.1 unnamed protein product [Penicillium salamii]
MTQAAQYPTESVKSMFPTDSGGVNNPASETLVDSYQSLDPARASLEDYNRSMLQYTQRQMSTFVDVDDSHRGSGTSSRSSQSSGQSGRSNDATGMARNANGPPTSVNTAAHLATSKVSGRDMADNESAAY